MRPTNDTGVSPSPNSNQSFHPTEPPNMSADHPTPVMEQVFNHFDENHDGKISPTELQNCVKTVGGDLSKEEAETAVQLSDSDEDGMLNMKEFSKLVQEKTSGVAADEELREAFRMYTAAEGKGCITPKSLKRMLSRLGQANSVEDCKAMITKFDLNGDGVLDFDEFRNMMKMQ